jgi:3',5'-cyclic AMP phosphodiesterase CpdA
MSLKTITILHISDLHVASGNEFDRSVVLDPLLERARKDKEKGLVPELVIVSGDIAYKGLKEEYALAHSFLNDLASVCGLSADSFFLVPGNLCTFTLLHFELRKMVKEW